MTHLDFEKRLCGVFLLLYNKIKKLEDCKVIWDDETMANGSLAKFANPQKAFSPVKVVVKESRGIPKKSFHSPSFRTVER